MKTTYKVIEPTRTVKHKVKLIKKVKRWWNKASTKISKWKNRNLMRNWFCFIIIFPLIVGGIYMIPHPQIIAASVGELLAFYGAALGILGSFQTFFLEKRKDEEQRRKDLRPRLFVEITKDENTYELPTFKIKVKNIGMNVLTDWYMYDEYISKCMEVQKENEYEVTYNKTEEELESLKNKNGFEPQYNFTADDEIEEDGYPKYIYFICDDIDGNEWYCSYIRIQNGKDFYYYPEEIKIQAVG